MHTRSADAAAVMTVPLGRLDAVGLKTGMEGGVTMEYVASARALADPG